MVISETSCDEGEGQPDPVRLVVVMEFFRDTVFPYRGLDHYGMKFDNVVEEE